MKVISDYDEKNDVLYLNFSDTGKPQEAFNSYSHDGVIFRYNKQGTVIGITIINLKRFLPNKNRGDEKSE